MRISDWSSDVCSSDLPFARGVTQALVGERLDTVPALQRETTHFWNWLGEKPNGKAKSTGRMAWGVTMADGTPVLGNVELKGRALMLAVTSAERAKRGTALINDALAGLVGTPLTTIETVEQAMAAGAERHPGGRKLQSERPGPDAALTWGRASETRHRSEKRGAGRVGRRAADND